VLEDYFHAGPGADVGNTRAHHSGANYSDLSDGTSWLPDGPRPACVDVLHVEEERLDHVLGDLAGGEFCQVPRLDCRCRIEVDLRALHSGRENRDRGWD